MPDLTIENYWCCLSNESFSTFVASSDGSKTYQVTFGPNHKNKDRVVNDWACTCPAYEHRPGYCKHIKRIQAAGERCGWHKFVDGGEPEYSGDTPCCPNCGGPVTTQRMGV